MVTYYMLCCYCSLEFVIHWCKIREQVPKEFPNRIVNMLRLGRSIVVLAAAAFLLPFTILLMVADQQYNLIHSFKRVIQEEVEQEQFLQIKENNSNQYDADGLLSLEKFEEIEARMNSRREYLKNECTRTGLDDNNHKAYAWEYLVNRQYHVVWCNIFKAASTSWMYNFNLMANYSAEFLDDTDEVPLELARKRYGRPSVEAVHAAHNDSVTFLIVRHPLDRLASAYNDKIVHPWANSFHDKMGQKIVQKYRKKEPVNGEPVPTEKYPLFEEFITYLLDEVKRKRPLDMHWTPYTDFCTPCKFEIDVILKFETLDEDQRYLIQLANIQHIVKPERKNVGEGSQNLHIDNLYAQLTEAQLDGLYSLYKYDFQLFNYTMDSYYQILDSSKEEKEEEE